MIIAIHMIIEESLSSCVNSSTNICSDNSVSELEHTNNFAFLSKDWKVGTVSRPSEQWGCVCDAFWSPWDSRRGGWKN